MSRKLLLSLRAQSVLVACQMHHRSGESMGTPPTRKGNEDSLDDYSLSEPVEGLADPQTHSATDR